MAITRRINKRKTPIQSHRNSNHNKKKKYGSDQRQRKNITKYTNSGRQQYQKVSYDKTRHHANSHYTNSHNTTLRHKHDHKNSPSYKKREYGPKIHKKSYSHNNNNNSNTTKSCKDLCDNLFAVLGGRVCSGCGFKDRRALGIASKYGGVWIDDASESVKPSWEKYTTNTDLATTELVVLCLNCNRIREPVTRTSKKAIAATTLGKTRRKSFPR